MFSEATRGHSLRTKEPHAAQEPRVADPGSNQTLSENDPERLHLFYPEHLLLHILRMSFRSAKVE